MPRTEEGVWMTRTEEGVWMTRNVTSTETHSKGVKEFHYVQDELPGPRMTIDTKLVDCQY